MTWLLSKCLVVEGDKLATEQLSVSDLVEGDDLATTRALVVEGDDLSKCLWLKGMTWLLSKRLALQTRLQFPHPQPAPS